MKRNRIKKRCLICNKGFKTIPYMIKKGWGKLCSPKCRHKYQSIIMKNRKHSEKIKIKMGKSMKEFYRLHPNFHKGQNNSRWKNGIKHTAQGYVKIYQSNHPFALDNYVFEHRLVIEKIIGRYLLPEERVHHINGIKNDNRKENLQLFINEREHQKFHHNHQFISPSKTIDKT